MNAVLTAVLVRHRGYLCSSLAQELNRPNHATSLPISGKFLASPVRTHANEFQTPWFGG